MIYIKTCMGNTIRAHHSWFLSSSTPCWLLLSVRLKEVKRSCWVQSHSLFLFHVCLAVELILVCFFSVTLLFWEVLQFILLPFVTLWLRIRKQGFKSLLWPHIKTTFNGLVFQLQVWNYCLYWSFLIFILLLFLNSDGETVVGLLDL